MSKDIAVDGLTISHAAGSPISGGTFTIVSSPSTKTKVDGNGIFTTPLIYTFAGGNASGHSPGSVATPSPQTIIATSQKSKDYGILVIRKDDSGLMVCAGSAGPISGNVEITDAGQDKVKAG